MEKTTLIPELKSYIESASIESIGGSNQDVIKDREDFKTRLTKVLSIMSDDQERQNAYLFMTERIKNMSFDKDDNKAYQKFFLPTMVEAYLHPEHHYWIFLDKILRDLPMDAEIMIKRDWESKNHDSFRVHILHSPNIRNSEYNDKQEIKEYLLLDRYLLTPTSCVLESTVDLIKTPPTGYFHGSQDTNGWGGKGGGYLPTPDENSWYN